MGRFIGNKDGGLTERPPKLSEKLASIPNNTNQSLWLFDSGLRRLNFWMLICLISSFGAGYDGSLFTGLLTLKLWFVDMGIPDSNMIGIIGMSGVVGMIVGPFLGGLFSDRFGRPKTMLVGAVIAVIGGVLTAIKLEDPIAQRNLFICARVIISLASGFTMVAAPVLMAELAHPRQRAVVASLYQCGFYSGSVVAAWLTFGTNGWTTSWMWRMPCLFQIAPFVLQLAVLFFCPESPRYLVARGRRDEAQKTLAKYHANGDENDALVQFELEEISAAIAAEKASANTTLKDLFSTPGNRHRMWIVITLSFVSQWSGNGVISYYLTRILASVGVESTRQQAIFNGGLALFNLVIASMAAFTAEYVGRRRLWITSAFGMLFSFIVITVCSAVYAKDASPAAGKAVIAFLFIFFFFYDIALTPLSVSYPVEILPYNIRSKGMAVSISVVAVALCFNIWVNPIALAAIGWKLYFVYIGVLIFFCADVVLTFPETRGRTVEEIAAIFDSTDAVEAMPEVGESRFHRGLEGEGPLQTLPLPKVAGSSSSTSEDEDMKKEGTHSGTRDF